MTKVNFGAAATALLFLGAAQAQTLDPKAAAEQIVGSPVHEQAAQSDSVTDRVLAAIENAPAAAAEVRKATSTGSVEIVLLPDAMRAEGGPPPKIDAKLKERQTDIEALRDDLEGNAMLYHAIASRQILLDHVLAVDFPDGNSVIIYAAGKPTQ